MPWSQPQPSPTPSQEAREAVELARKDLSQRENLDPREIVLLEVETVLWRDTSLGCPEPGKAYAQVITPGFRVLLSHAGGQYEYHSEGAKRVVLCQSKP